jgi:iron(III) transport system ATP-binding protein
VIARDAAVAVDGRRSAGTAETPDQADPAAVVADAQGVRVTGLFKSFSTQPVLRGVDLDVPAGSFTAILGPSGSGKTTLLRILAGFDRMDAGSVVIGGQVMEDGRRFVRAQRRGIGYVPQEGALFPHLTVADNVGFGMPRRERKEIAHLVELVGLEGLERRYPHQLSGGQQQRVALARALAIKPKVVLLDEPFSSLDASLRDGVRRDVAHILAEANATTILVTHDQDEALGLADQIAVLVEGSIVAIDDPRSLYGDPSDLAAAVLIGDANIMEAEMDNGKARCVLGTVDVAPREAGSGEGSVQLLLRPEQLAIHVEPEDGRVQATVIELQYHGHDALVRVAIDAPGTQAFSARVPGDLALSPGQPVWLTLRGPGRVWTDR